MGDPQRKRKAKPKICEDGSSRKGDLISKLPDHLLCDILYHVSTKESVRTSVLSKRWRNIWQGVLGLDLDYRRFSTLNAFKSLVDKFLDIHKSWIILKLRLYIRVVNDDSSLFIRWIDAATRRKIQHLDVGTCSRLYQVPLSIYTCETLVHLRLHKALMYLFDGESVSLPCLKSMSLENIKFPLDGSHTTFGKLISGSPVLEDLTIIHHAFYPIHLGLLQVRSQSLKRIFIDTNYYRVVIDAPLLRSLRTKFNSIKNFEIISSGVSGKLDIDIIESGYNWPPDNGVTHGNNLTLNILTHIPRIRDLGISGDMWKDIFDYSKSGPSVQFCYLTHLNAKVSISNILYMLRTVLECCPKLESLILEMLEEVLSMLGKSFAKPRSMYLKVPQCLVSSVKFVDLKSSNTRNGREKELVRYFLKNSTILEKVKVDLQFTEKAKCAFRKQLDTMPRCSSSCEVHLL